MTELDKMKRLRREVRDLKHELQELEKKYLKLKCNHTRLYDWTTEKFNCWIDMSAKGSTPALPWLIKNTKDILVKTNF